MSADIEPQVSWDVDLAAVPVTELLDRVDWGYEADRTLTIHVPEGTPLGDELHEYLREIGEPLEY